MSPRSDLGARVADLIKSKGGNVVSVVPPRAHEQVVFETRTPELGESIAEMLRERNFHVNALGTTERLVHNATEEIVEMDLGDGVKRQRVVTAPGHARFHSFEVVLPADSLMREIPGQVTPRPVKPPVQRRRRG